MSLPGKGLSKNKPSIGLINTVGAYRREVEFHKTKLFFNGSTFSDNKHELAKDENIYYPQCCFTTRSLGSTGWNSSAVHCVFSIDFPTDILSIL